MPSNSSSHVARSPIISQKPSQPMQAMSLPCRVFLFPIKSTQAKLHAIVSAATHHFKAKERLLFLVVDEAAAKYVDELLWKQPPEGVLPHKILKAPSNDMIGITSTLENLNQSAIIFNLRPEATTLLPMTSIIYDFIDETSPSRHELSLKRREFYSQEGCSFS